MKKRFDGKVALITGSTSGIGRAAALRLAKEGAKVALTGRNEEVLAELKEQIEKTGGVAWTKSANLLDPTSIEGLVDEAVEHFGQLDILINAAGIIASGTIETTSLEEWQQMIQLNTTAPFLLMQKCLPHLIKTKGNILNVSSITGIRAFPGVLAYCTSKAALDQLTHCAALEVADKGVRINAINPGVVKTNLHKRSGMDEEAYQDFLERSKRTHPMGYVGTPENIADLISFLVSDEASWITGASYPIDGGRAQTCAR